MSNTCTADAGFHAGELAVQVRAGLRAQAARLEGMLAPANLSSGLSRFLAGGQFAALTARDRSGSLWVSPLLGPPGFLDAHDAVLDVHASLATADPLRDLPVGQQVGVICVEFATRRRVRVNGTLTLATHSALSIAVEQAFGNCPSYIQRRDLHVTTRQSGTTPSLTHRLGGDSLPTPTVRALTTDEKALVVSADTFFLGTTHHTRGADTSHKGGRPGFVRLDGNGDIWWPDYAGNNMFNSLGNLAENPEAALMFPDFSSGAVVQLSGTAELEWAPPGGPGDDGDTGRRVRFHPQAVASAVRLPIRAGAVDASPHNPELR